MEDFPDITNLDKILDEGEDKATKISEQYDQGFITDDERYRLTVENWLKVDSTVQSTLADQLTNTDNTMSIAITSGARGNVGQMKNSVGMLGVLSDTSGRPIELPVKSGFKQGLNQLEYFTGTRGARKALIDIALKTADSGYLTRRLVDVSQDVFTVDDDGVEDPGFTIFRADADEIGVPFSLRIEGRFAAEDIVIGKEKVVAKGELINRTAASQINDSDLESVKIMSVLTSNSTKGISPKSYGIDPATGLLVVNRAPIGVIAAQSIGEPGTQLSLDSKHRAGAVTADETAQGLSRVEELFEVRTPKGQAFLSEASGIASVWEDGEHYVVQVTGAEEKEVSYDLEDRTPTVKSGQEVATGDVIASKEGGANPIVASISGKVNFKKANAVITPSSETVVRYEIPGFKQLTVKDGDEVQAGDRLTNGSVNLQDLMALKGVEETQRYIINEISKIFASQGQNINDKHFEVIVRQMF